MKTITIDDKKIEISDESYEAFKKQFVTKDKAILWKPEDGEGFYCVSTYGMANYYVWKNFDWQIQDWELGNIFKTKEEAEEDAKTGWIAKRKAEVEILRFIAENDLEWEFAEVLDDAFEDKSYLVDKPQMIEEDALFEQVPAKCVGYFSPSRPYTVPIYMPIYTGR